VDRARRRPKRSAAGRKSDSLQGGSRFRFGRFSAVEIYVHHDGTPLASGPSATGRTPGVASAYPLTGYRR
jgi:hypothetical protein